MESEYRHLLASSEAMKQRLERFQLLSLEARAQLLELASRRMELDAAQAELRWRQAQRTKT